MYSFFSPVMCKSFNVIEGTFAVAKHYIAWNQVVINLAFQSLPKFGQSQQRVGDNQIPMLCWRLGI